LFQPQTSLYIHDVSGYSRLPAAEFQANFKINYAAYKDRLFLKDLLN